MVKNFHFTVEEGKTIMDVQPFLSTLKELKDGKYVISVKKQTKPRSLNQNRYYWDVIIPLIGDYCGYDSDETHEALKMHFLKSFHGQKGDFPTIKSTAHLSTIEFEQYCSDVRMWASKELGVYIPLPNEIIS